MALSLSCSNGTWGGSITIATPPLILAGAGHCRGSIQARDSDIFWLYTRMTKDDKRLLVLTTAQVAFRVHLVAVPFLLFHLRYLHVCMMSCWTWFGLLKTSCATSHCCSNLRWEAGHHRHLLPCLELTWPNPPYKDKLQVNIFWLADLRPFSNLTVSDYRNCCLPVFECSKSWLFLI